MTPDGYTENRQLRPQAEIRLHKCSNHVSPTARRNHTGGGAVAAFEIVTQHAGAAADAAELQRSCFCLIEGFNHILSCHMEAIDIIEISIIGLGGYRETPVERHAATDEPADGGIARNPAGMRVGNGDRGMKLA